MLKKALIFLILMSLLVTTVSAAEEGDTRIVGTNQHVLPDIDVGCGEEIKIIAELDEFGPKALFGIYDDLTPRDWSSCTFRDLDLGVTDSAGNLIRTDRARTRFITDEAHFGIFKLNNPGDYICTIKYVGGLKHCKTQFWIHVT
jgi:hypothetical protein